MAIDLNGQVALITGANRGIGRQIAGDLVKSGARVVAGARNPDSLEDLVQAGDGRCEAVALDVTNDAQVTAAIDGTVERHGKLDLLVNNAGIGGGAELPWETPIDEWWAVQEVNVRGVYACSQAAMRHMAKQKSGRIIDVGSLVGTYPMPAAAPYAASKCALFRWNSCLALAAADFGVSVFIISPGLVATDMTADIPFFDDVPAEQWTPIEKTGALVVALASGKADALRGRFIHAENDLDELIAHADEIIEQNLQTLGMSFYDED
ncbi:MAG: SDR family oxidoreductase [Gammaproteobacteria bacterium]|jgi:NAD(P)-dependent dehydrogenase (short-subunit alcohol dehydrogenase family)|nr:MAG: SDR family oxidoreductase [Gammaproteobacteria bacterium]